MGLPGSGKTYLSERLQPLLESAWFNADKVRSMAGDWDFSEEGRLRQSLRMKSIDQVTIEEYSEIDINILQDDIKTSFLPAWTVKVSSYNDLTELKRDLAELKKMGYKVYSQYESNDKINFSLFIGPTLNREDSIIIFDEISNMKKFNPEILKYD